MKKIIILLSFLMIFYCSKTENLEKNIEKINSWKIEESTEILKEDFQKWEKIVLPWKVHFSYENWKIVADNKEIKIEKLEKLPDWFSYNKEIFCKENQKKENFLWLNFCLEKNIETFWAMQWCWNNFSDLENSLCFINLENKKINIFKSWKNNFSLDFDKNLKFYFFENILFINWEKEDFMIIFS